MAIACAVLHTDSSGRTIPCPGYPHPMEERDMSDEKTPAKKAAPEKAPVDRTGYKIIEQGLTCQVIRESDGTGLGAYVPEEVDGVIEADRKAHPAE